MMLPSLLKKELNHKHTDNFAIKPIYKHFGLGKVYMKKKTTKKKCYLKNIQNRRHFRYLQNNNNTQVKVDKHHDCVPF